MIYNGFYILRDYSHFCTHSVERDVIHGGKNQGTNQSGVEGTSVKVSSDRGGWTMTGRRLADGH